MRKDSGTQHLLFHYWNNKSTVGFHVIRSLTSSQRRFEIYLQTFVHVYQLWADITLMLCMLIRSIHTGELFSIIKPPTVDEVLRLINSMSGKSSPIDNIPTSIMKSCADVFAPLITQLATHWRRKGSAVGGPKILGDLGRYWAQSDGCLPTVRLGGPVPPRPPKFRRL